MASSVPTSDLPPIRIGGVPEHFSLPLIRALESGLFSSAGERVEFIEIPQGTGAMLQKLKEGSVDIIIALTEGLFNDIASNLPNSPVVLLGTYVHSPLIWAISSGFHSSINSIDELQGKTFGISRYQSGSHLMASVLASQRGWPQNTVSFSVLENFQNLRSAAQDGKIQAFLWERGMCAPYYQKDKQEIKKIGEISAPWPAFLFASTKLFLSSSPNIRSRIQRILAILKQSIQAFYTAPRSEILSQIQLRYHLPLSDAELWLEKAKIVGDSEIELSTFVSAWKALKEAGILTEKALKSLDSNGNLPHSEVWKQFIDPELCRIRWDLQSMGLYNTHALLTAFHQNLQAAGITKAAVEMEGKQSNSTVQSSSSQFHSFSWRDLLAFDQNHYHGTAALDQFMSIIGREKSHLKSASSNSQSSDSASLKPFNFLQIGSSLGGCTRYLTAEYGISSISCEIQPALHESALEITQHCREWTQFRGNIRFLQGNVLDYLGQSPLSWPLEPEALKPSSSPFLFDSIASWITLLHFNRIDRDKLFHQSFAALRSGGIFYSEDFVVVEEKTQEQTQEQMSNRMENEAFDRVFSEVEKNELLHSISSPYLSTRSEYESALRAAGFHTVHQEDLTPSWYDFLRNRRVQWENRSEELKLKHGSAIYDSLLEFYRRVERLFQGGKVGGIRIWAVKQ